MSKLFTPPQGAPAHGALVRNQDQRAMKSLSRTAPATLLIAAIVLALSSCATVSPEARVRTKLIEAGLPAPVAQCMAQRMVDRLSLVQLRRLQSLGGLATHDPRGLSIDEFAYRLRALNDPEILSVVLKAGIGCSIAA